MTVYVVAGRGYPTEAAALAEREALAQDGYAAEVEAYEDQSKPVVVMGHEFVPMTEADWLGLAGAEPGTLICHEEHYTLLWHPPTQVLSELYENCDGVTHQCDWSRAEVV